MPFEVPVRENEKLKKLLAAINGDQELLQLWKCANVNAVDRCGISDHGEVHIRIVANAALKVFRLLVKADIEPSVVKHHGLTVEDAEVIVVLAAALHDLGISIHRDNHEQYSLFIANPKARALLAGIYDEPELTIMVSEVLHAVIAHNAKQTCLTIEAGALKVADTLDMSEGRSRIPFEAGEINIHSVSAKAVESVAIEKGDDRPVRIVVTLANWAGIYQVDDLLGRKLKNSTLAPYVEVVARIEEGDECRTIDVFKL
ncbi:MAG: HD domain-containing protein [Verrucomicrobia bacterium]|nr:HD domain-containing protein [Verrucomicrobiota bacterium]